MGPGSIHQLPDLIEEVGRGKTRLSRIELTPGGPYPHPLPMTIGFPRSLNASVTIMQGCNNYCAYCLVPFVRGSEESRPAKEIVAEVEALTARGAKEILLLGQNVNSYGQNRVGEISFCSITS